MIHQFFYLQRLPSIRTEILTDIFYYDTNQSFVEDICIIQRYIIQCDSKSLQQIIGKAMEHKGDSESYIARTQMPSSCVNGVVKNCRIQSFL